MAEANEGEMDFIHVYWKKVANVTDVANVADVALRKVVRGCKRFPEPWITLCNLPKATSVTLETLVT